MGRFSDNSYYRYVYDIKNKPILEKEEVIELSDKVKSGDEEARAEFIEKNLRLVVKIAQSYANESFSISDIIQEGNIGLIRAVDTFDASKGYTFATYATQCIKNEISTFFNRDASSVKYSRKINHDIYQCKKFEKEYEDKYGCEPTVEETSNAINMSREKVEKLKDYNKKIVNLDTLISLEEELGNFCDEIQDGDMSVLEDKIENLKNKITDVYGIKGVNLINSNQFFEISDKTTEDIILEKDFYSDIHDLVYNSYLFPQEIEVLECRFGLGNRESLSLRSIGMIHGVKKDSVRNKENKALRKLKIAASMRGLNSYLTDTVEETKK